MHRNLSILTSLAIVVSASGSIGCSSSTGSSAGSGSSSGSGMPTVSFKTDVMPLFQAGCTLSMECHGQTGNPGEENLYLGVNQPGTTGEPVDSMVAAMVYAGLVGVASVEAPSVDLVAKGGDTANSYLLQKLIGDQNTMFASQCSSAATPCSAISANCTASTPCGVFMPSGGELWSTSNPTGLQTITDWISQGAMNN
jgi:hypothetical protein